MRPCPTPTMAVRSAVFGGPRPLICVPLVAGTLDELASQAAIARALAPDIIEWRADAFGDLTVDAVGHAARALRDVLDREPVIFTLRVQAEGGATPLDQGLRRDIIASVIRAGLADLIDVELRNGTAWVAPLVTLAHERDVRVILSFHDFAGTPNEAFLLQQIAEMVRQGADVAKVACMPKDAADVLRLLHTTHIARHLFPAVPLCTMSMGSLGLASRVTGCLYGSDMTFAAGKASSAPGQIPVADLRVLLDGLLKYA